MSNKFTRLSKDLTSLADFGTSVSLTTAFVLLSCGIKPSYIKVCPIIAKEFWLNLHLSLLIK
jgi:hypothetical protein